MTTKVTQSLFTAVKIMLENGATMEETAKYMKISTATVKWIKKAENLDEYKAILAACYARKKKPEKKPEKKAEKKEIVLDKCDPPVQVVEHRQSVTIQATHYMMQEMQETNKLLKEISNKLAYIVEQLS